MSIEHKRQPRIKPATPYVTIAIEPGPAYYFGGHNKPKFPLFAENFLTLESLLAPTGMRTSLIVPSNIVSFNNKQGDDAYRLTENRNLLKDLCTDGHELILESPWKHAELPAPKEYGPMLRDHLGELAAIAGQQIAYKPSLHELSSINEFGNLTYRKEWLTLPHYLVIDGQHFDAPSLYSKPLDIPHIEFPDDKKMKNGGLPDHWLRTKFDRIKRVVNNADADAEFQSEYLTDEQSRTSDWSKNSVDPRHTVLPIYLGALGKATDRLAKQGISHETLLDMQREGDIGCFVTTLCNNPDLNSINALFSHLKGQSNDGYICVVPSRDYISDVKGKAPLQKIPRLPQFRSNAHPD